MKSEELKIIAEGMGYYVNPSMEDGVTIDINGHWFDYNPDTTNDTQCMEIMERLKLSVRWQHDICYVSQTRYFASGVSNGKTIREAVCKAALEYFKQ